MDPQWGEPETWSPLMEFYWTRAFLKALVIANGGRMEVPASVLEQVVGQDTQLFFDKEDDKVFVALMRGGRETH